MDTCVHLDGVQGDVQSGEKERVAKYVGARGIGGWYFKHHKVNKLYIM